MALTCPNCAKRIGAATLKESFACSSCGVQLRGHTTRAFILGFGLWMAADFVLMLALGSFGADEGLALGLRIAVSTVVGFLLYFWGLPAWSSVERRE